MVIVHVHGRPCKRPAARPFPAPMRAPRTLTLLAALSLGAGPAFASAPARCPDDIPRSPQPPRGPGGVQIPAGAKVTRTDVHIGCPLDRWPVCTSSSKVAITLASGERQTLSHSGELRFERGPAPTHTSRRAGCGGEPDRPIYLRHYWIASAGERHTAVMDVGYGLGATVFVTLESPPGFDMIVNLGLSSVSGETGMLAHRADDSATMEGLRITRVVAPSPLRAGGPFVAMGGALMLGGAERGEPKLASRPRLRLGYEMARPYWLIESLVAETDFRSLVLVPTVEAAISGSWSQVVALGVGVPVRLIDHNTVGIRGQFAIQFPVLGVVQALDYYPALAGRERVVMSIFGQLSL